MPADFSIARRRMVNSQIESRGISDPEVIRAMLKVPRHLFVDEALRSHAYGDAPLPIGDKQTISQPFMVAAMTAALELKGNERILEIGTGSGYQAAVLAEIVSKVYTVERITNLASRARRIFDQLRYTNINLKMGDGTCGWKEQAPFDGILVTAGAPGVPDEYLDQLKEGGHLIMPVGDLVSQSLKKITLLPGGNIHQEDLMGCKFVPLIGQKGWPDRGLS